MKVWLVVFGLIVFASFLRLWIAYVDWVGQVTGVSEVFSVMTVLAKVGFFVVAPIVVAAVWQDAKRRLLSRVILAAASLIALLIVLLAA